jgi:hypothetical protein
VGSLHLATAGDATRSMVQKESDGDWSRILCMLVSEHHSGSISHEVAVIWRYDQGWRTGDRLNTENCRTNRTHYTTQTQSLELLPTCVLLDLTQFHQRESATPPECPVDRMVWQLLTNQFLVGPPQKTSLHQTVHITKENLGSKHPEPILSKTVW